MCSESVVSNNCSWQDKLVHQDTLMHQCYAQQCINGADILSSC